VRRLDVDNTFNVVHTLEHFTFRAHTCITFELLAMNLYELIKKNRFHGFSLGLVRKFAHSMLRSETTTTTTTTTTWPITAQGRRFYVFFWVRTHPLFEMNCLLLCLHPT